MQCEINMMCVNTDQWVTRVSDQNKHRGKVSHRKLEKHMKLHGEIKWKLTTNIGLQGIYSKIWDLSLRIFRTWWTNYCLRR